MWTTLNPVKRAIILESQNNQFKIHYAGKTMFLDQKIPCINSKLPVKESSTNFGF